MENLYTLIGITVMSILIISTFIPESILEGLENENENSTNSTSYKSYNNDPMILAQQNAGNIKYLKGRISKIDNMNNQISKLKNQINQLQQQVNELS